MAKDCWRTPKIVEVIFPNIIWGANSDTKEIFLTFDDGPDPETTPLLLEYLNINKIKACFFVRGDKAQQHPDIISAIVNNGHILGYHGLSHISWWFRSKSFYHQQVNPQQIETLNAHFTDNLCVFRPPYGRFDFKVLKHIKDSGGKMVLWRLAVGDWIKSKSWETIAADLVTHCKPGDIVLLHDSSSNGKYIIDILDYFLKNLDTKGIVPGDPGRLLK